MISLPLCGCGGKTIRAQESFTAWRGDFLAREEHSITAAVRISQEDAVSEYTLAYALTPEEETVEVLAPELIASIKAHIEEDSARLSYDGVILDAGSSAGGLTPMTALPRLMDFIESGHLESSWAETRDGLELYATELELEDGSKLVLWQEQAGMTPVYGEIRVQNAVEAAIDIQEIS